MPLLVAEDPETAIATALAEMERRAAHRARFYVHLENCEQCADATRALCHEGAHLVRKALSASPA